MPRESFTVTLDLRVTYKLILTKLSVLAPLPIEESDVESAAEDVPSANAKLAETNDEPADATMKDKEEEEEEEDDDNDEGDPETSVWALLNYRTLLTTAQFHCRSHQGPPLRLRRRG